MIKSSYCKNLKHKLHIWHSYVIKPKNQDPDVLLFVTTYAFAGASVCVNFVSVLDILKNPMNFKLMIYCLVIYYRIC